MCKVSVLLRITVNYIAIISTKSCKCTTEITNAPYSQGELEQFDGRSKIWCRLKMLKYKGARLWINSLET